MISMNEPLDSLLKELFLLDPPWDLFETLKQINLKGVKNFLKILASSRLLQGSYICRK
jgi:hypothetical protein